MPELTKTFTVRWPGATVEEVQTRLLAELDRLALGRWGFLGFKRLKWEVRKAPNSEELAAMLGGSVRADPQFGNASFVFPADVEVWEAWATYEEMGAWKYAEEGADHWAP